MDPATEIRAEKGWCARIAGGPGGAAVDVPVALSAVHADVRYFGAAESNAQIDGALVQGVVDAKDKVDETAAAGFARALDSVCLVAKDDRPVAATTVERRGKLAVVHPGKGAPTIPSDVIGYVLDLRDLPNAPEVDLDAAVAAVVPSTFAPPPTLLQRVQVRTGLTDEVFTEASPYVTETKLVPLTIAAGAAKKDLPLAIVVGPRMTPAAARVALVLRASNRAWLLGGSDLSVEVAESRWSAVGSVGIARRVADAELAGHRLPNSVPVDGPADDATMASLLASGAPPAIAAGVAERIAISERRDFKVPQDGTVSVATTRAGLLSAHGAMKLFFPYFGTIADSTDAVLLETLADAAKATDRSTARNLFRRLGAAITDGHNWVEDLTPPPEVYAGVLPIVIDRGEGAPFVSRTYTPSFALGDTVLAIDGVLAETWFSNEMKRSYGATEGFRFFNAAVELTQYTLPRSVRVRAAGGAERDVVVTPTPYKALATGSELYAGSTRRRGWLADLGEPNVYYFNLDGQYVSGDADMTAGLTEAASARGVVLDMRGHPSDGSVPWNAYEFLQRIIQAPFASPRYRVPVLAGDGTRSDIHPYEGTYTPLASPAYTGRVVLIVDHQAVSFAEDFSMMLVGAGRATVVGRPTAGTTGSISGLALPAGFNFYFTGMEARWPDGHVLFGEGVVPDVKIEPTAADVTAGIDPFLTAAIHALR